MFQKEIVFQNDFEKDFETNSETKEAAFSKNTALIFIDLYFGKSQVLTVFYVLFRV